MKILIPEQRTNKGRLFDTSQNDTALVPEPLFGLA
jgi:hypothetical protein